MAYADPVDPATPGDPDIAGQGDDRIREFKRGIRQRLMSFFIDVDADPLVPKHASIPVDVFNDDSVDGKFLKVASVPADRVIGGGGGGGAPGPNTVNSAALQDNSVTNLKIGDNAVDERTIAPDSVGNSEMKDDAINTAEIVDNAITRPKIAAATRGVLAYITKGSFNVPAGNLLAGPTYHKTIDIPVAINGVVPPNAIGIINPEHSGDGIIFDALIVGGNKIRVEARDTDNSGAKDLSGTVIHWMVVQVYAGAVPE